MQKSVDGVLPPIATPFKQDGPLELTGFRGGYPRLPLVPPGENQHQVLQSILESAGVLEPAGRV